MQHALSNGRLYIAQCDVVSLAAEHGTPLYVLDEQVIRNRCREYVSSFTAPDINTHVAYSAKSFFCSDIARIIQSESLWLDVNSGGELYAALAFGISPDRILFHGNNKTAAELSYALQQDVGRIVVDSQWELELLGKLAQSANKTASVLLRIAPGVSPETHEYINTGEVDSKFGLAIDGGYAQTAAEYAHNHDHLHLLGLHAHVGSQLMTSDAVCMGAHRLVELAKTLSRSGIPITELDVGGGLGVNYCDTEPVSITDFCADIITTVQTSLSKLNVTIDRLFIEPGRSIIAPAGITIYQIGGVKHSPNGKRYISVDGGMADNPRPSLYQANYRAVIADKVDAKPTARYDVVGRYCESGDVLVKDCPLPDVKHGDFLCMFATGAYQMSMASNYNMVPRPAVVMVSGSRTRLIVGRETYADLLARDECLDVDKKLIASYLSSG